MARILCVMLLVSACGDDGASSTGDAVGGASGFQATTGGTGGSLTEAGEGAAAISGAQGATGGSTAQDPVPSTHPSCAEVQCVACEVGQMPLAVVGACCPDCVEPERDDEVVGCTRAELDACPSPPESCPPGYSTSAVSERPDCCVRCRPEVRYCRDAGDCVLASTCSCCSVRSVSVRTADEDPCVTGADATPEPLPASCTPCGCGNSDVVCPQVPADTEVLCTEGVCAYDPSGIEF